MDFQNLIIKQENGTGTVIVNRPDKLNALNAATIDELKTAFLSLQESDNVKAVILTGAGEKAFIAGADIGELAVLDLRTGKEYVRRGQELTELIENLNKPVIAAVNGYALGGGCELAMACHVRIASDNAKLGQPEVKLGVIPGYGGTQRLPRLVGKGIALELLLSGRTIGAEEALKIGLINRFVPQAELIPACEALAAEITANGPCALEYCIKAVNKGLDQTLKDGLLTEAGLFGEVCATGDSKEGTRAFLEKRKPDFQGK